MNILAVDPATVSGFAVGEPGSAPRLWTVDFRNKKNDELEAICANAVGHFTRAVLDHKPTHLAIELPFPSQRFATMQITLGLYGIMTGVAIGKGLQIMRAPISEWRKYFLGTGKLPGKESKRAALAVCKQFGWSAPDHNAAEAAGIWCWATGQLKLNALRPPLIGNGV